MERPHMAESDSKVLGGSHHLCVCASVYVRAACLCALSVEIVVVREILHLQVLANLTSDVYATNIRKLITDEKTQDLAYYGGAYEHRVGNGTSHLNVLAPDGGAVSLTGTINT